MKLCLAIMMLCVCTIAIASNELYPFDNPHDSQRFLTLTKELRCLVCQNQNLAESNADLANDLRQKIYLKVKAGESNQAIIDYLVQRYGDFVLYQPPFKSATLLLWTMPFILLLIGLSILFIHIRKSKSTTS